MGRPWARRPAATRKCAQIRAHRLESVLRFASLMRTLPVILLVLAATRAEAFPDVYVAQQDGAISVLHGEQPTNYTPVPFPTSFCPAVDGAADPGGGVVWFVTSCGEAFTIEDHGFVTLKVSAPLPLTPGRPMRI